ncbi:MAG: DUF1648 domain-containing protein [Ruminococcaceae bacterium]|nr:DUF1648 domain-containing protein [Oscillospiraceae bacterium]
MNRIKWKSLLMTCIICLAGILPGLLTWDLLPDRIAIHFDIHNTPDNFSGKGFAVFGLPLIMMLGQLIACILWDYQSALRGENKKVEWVIKGILPVMTMLLQLATIGFALGYSIDIRKVACLGVGIIFLLVGNYLPKLDYVKNFQVNKEKARKINRFWGFATVIMGILFLISIFLPPVFGIICLFLMLPYAILLVGYGVYIRKK